MLWKMLITPLLSAAAAAAAAAAIHRFVGGGKASLLFRSKKEVESETVTYGRFWIGENSPRRDRHQVIEGEKHCHFRLPGYAWRK